MGQNHDQEFVQWADELRHNMVLSSQVSNLHTDACMCMHANMQSYFKFPTRMQPTTSFMAVGVPASDLAEEVDEEMDEFLHWLQLSDEDDIDSDFHVDSVDSQVNTDDTDLYESEVVNEEDCNGHDSEVPIADYAQVPLSQSHLDDTNSMMEGKTYSI